MANKFSMRAAIFFSLLCVVFSLRAFSQEQKKSFSQKLEWKSQTKAYEYKVEVKDVSGKVKSFTTKNNFIEISMPSGNYEFRVTAFDFLGREATKTEWKKFTIKKAVMPKVNALTDRIAFGENDTFSVPLETQDTSASTKIELLDQNGKVVANAKVQDGSAVFEKVPDGNYKLRVTNPGGRFAETNSIKITEKTDEEIRLEEEARLAEEKRLEEERLAQERRRLEEQQRLEEERRLAEEKRLEAQRLAEEKRLAEEARLAEEKRLEEERLAQERRRLEEQQRLEEEARLAEEKRLAEEARLAEEKRLEEERLAQEAAAAKEARKNRPAKDFYLLFGGSYLLGVAEKEVFDGKKNVIGGDLKIEYLPFKIKKFKLGFNLQTQFFPVVVEDSFVKESLFFMPLNLNLAFHIPLKEEKIYIGVQAGGGAIGLLQKEEYASMQDEYKREEKTNVYLNYMLDAGLVFRFIPAKHFAIDIASQFEFWRVGGRNIMNASFGVLLGVRF